MMQGYVIEPHSPDPLVELVDYAESLFTEAVVPGKWLVDAFPIRKYPDVSKLERIYRN